MGLSAGEKQGLEKSTRTEPRSSAIPVLWACGQTRQPGEASAGGGWEGVPEGLDSRPQMGHPPSEMQPQEELRRQWERQG